MEDLVKTNVLLEEGQLKAFKPTAKYKGYTNVSHYLRDHMNEEKKKYERMMRKKKNNGND